MRYFICLIMLILAGVNYSCKSEISKEERELSLNKVKNTINETSHTTESNQKKLSLEREYYELINERNQFRKERSKTSKGTEDYNAIHAKIIGLNKKIKTYRDLINNQVNQLIVQRDNLKLERNRFTKGTAEYNAVHSKVQELNQKISNMRKK